MELKKTSIFTKKRIIAGVLSALLLAGFAFGFYKLGQSNAPKKNGLSSNSKIQENRNDPKVQKELATKNLDTIKDRINKAQSNGTITKDQATKLLKKAEEMNKFYSTLLSKPVAEQGKLIVDKRKELRDWAKTNDVPTTYVSMMAMRF